MVEKWHSLDIKEIYDKTNSNHNGLSEKEVEERLKKFGKNEIQKRKQISKFRIFLEQLKSPLVIILVVSALILLIIDFLANKNEHGIDSILILAIVAMNCILGFYQNYKAEKSIEALTKKSTTKAIVMREGRIKTIDSTDLVVGDILILKEGSVVPADCRIIESSDLAVDESVLTGESIPVSKTNNIINENCTINERKNMLYMGTFVVRGSGKAIIVSTGSNTEIGKIAKYLEEAVETKTPFQEELEVLAKQIAIGIGILILFIVVVEIFFAKLSLMEIILISIALAVAAIPEGLPAVITLSMSISTKKMLDKNALVRKLAVVETLGSVDIICTDKTGTITEGKMIVEKIYFDNKIWEIENIENKNKTFEQLLTASVVCNNADLKNEFQGDPTEVALLIAAEKFGLKKEEIDKKYVRVKEIAFTSERKFMSVIVKYNQKKYIFSKGAPEVALQKCDRIFIDGREITINDKIKKEILLKNEEMASKALRVLAFCYKELKENEEEEKNLTFLGMEGMIDEPRKDVKESIDVCKKAGIRVVMITGDNLITAKAIAEKVGIGGDAIEGKDLDKMSDQKLEEEVEKINIYARTIPEHKFRILKALQKKGYVVAMTGDGVNDAPALKQADVGISMGIKGTDVARQASDIVLLDDNFATIVEAIKEGRNAFQNIRKFLVFLFRCNISEVLFVLTTSIIGFVPLTAVQILWINLVTDGPPAIALSFDPPKENIMEEKPIGKRERVLNRKIITMIFIIGLEFTIFLLILFFLSMSIFGASRANSLIFSAFVFYELLAVLTVRELPLSKITNNKWLILTVVLSLLLQLALIYSPINKLFRVIPLTLAELTLIIIFGILLWFTSKITLKEMNKRIWNEKIE